LSIITIFAIIFIGSSFFENVGTAAIGQTQGSFALYNCMVLGHTKYSGVDEVLMDLVMIHPPGIEAGEPS
jgi:hypothetical protein